MGQMVFVPLSRARALGLRESGVLADEQAGHAATESLMQAHDYDASTLEDAEFAALRYAGVQALDDSDEPTRLILAADLTPSQVSVADADPYGRVTVRDLRWADVQALFSDEESAAAAVAAARAAAAGLAFDDMLALPAVDALLEEHDLLWFAPEELDRLP
jgi:hypothetical protein